MAEKIGEGRGDLLEKGFPLLPKPLLFPSQDV